MKQQRGQVLANEKLQQGKAGEEGSGDIIKDDRANIKSGKDDVIEMDIDIYICMYL